MNQNQLSSGSGQHSETSQSSTRIIHYSILSPTDRDIVSIIYSCAKIRDFNEAQAVEALIPVINSIVTAYCPSTKNTEDIAWFAMAKMVRNHYAQLNILEISKAFELAAANKLQISLATYNQVFSASMLGDVLTAYIAYRQNAIAAYQKIKDEEDRTNKPTKNYAIIKTYDEAAIFWRNAVAAAMIGKPRFKSRDLYMTAIFHNIFVHYKIVQLTPEQKREIYRAALLELRNDLLHKIAVKLEPNSGLKKLDEGVLMAAAVLNSKVPKEVKEEAKGQIAEIEEHLNAGSPSSITNRELHAKAMFIVHKIAVWDHYLNPDIYKEKRDTFFEAWEVLGTGEPDLGLLLEFIKLDDEFLMDKFYFLSS